MRRRTFLAAALTPALAPVRAGAAPARTLAYVPYTDLAVLDPIVTTNYATRNHALMVFDTLYGVDGSYTPRPQMLAGDRVDDDGRTWILTLREGLRFHDDTPVLARDVVASLRRWGARDILGTLLFAATDELAATDDRTLRWRLKSPFPLLPFALGKTAGNMAAIMPERLALTDPARPVAELIGSGPFRYVAAERVQGHLNVYARFAAYQPRPEPADLLAGGKLAWFDRVEWHTLPDAATAAAALQQGEIDWWEQPTTDYWPLLSRRPGLTLDVLDTSGSYRYVRLNWLNPPFDRVAVRRAAMAAISQRDVVTAIAGTDPAMSRTGIGFFAPDSPMASDVGLAAMRDPPDREAARRLLAASGYAGEKVLMSIAATVVPINICGEVVADAWQRIGFDVDFRALEVAASLQQIASKAPVAQGGWCASADGMSGVSARDPSLLANLHTVGRNGGTYGWPLIPEVEALRNRYLAAPDLAARQAICRDIQRLCFEQVPYIPAGIVQQPTAYRSDLAGVLRGLPLFWSVRRA
jgi:peptide/nickel transport system substrate-binding protein